jgi:hypothetical protein
MGLSCNPSEHAQSGISPLFSPAGGDLLRVQSRRGFLQTGMAGMAGQFPSCFNFAAYLTTRSTMLTILDSMEK